MITAGIDVGARMVKVLIRQEDKVLAATSATTGLEEREGINQAFQAALDKAGITPDQVGKIFSTGMGAKLVDFANKNISINLADARGATFLFPTVRTVIDVGAEEGRVVTCEEGKVTSFAVNDRCAAGAGTFIDAMSRIMEVSPSQFGEMALQTESASQISSQCTVFAESEVISLISSESTIEEIARSVVNAVAERINSLARRLNVMPDVVLVGGMARNRGFVKALTKALELDQLLVPDEPEFIGALGAAIIAAD